MNVFALDDDPVLAAQALGDEHVRGKLLVEAAQVLHAALYRLGWRGPGDGEPGSLRLPNTRVAGDGRTPYNPGGRFAAWASASRANFDWLVAHARALAEEKRLRFGGDHATEARVEALAALAYLVPEGPRTPFARSEAVPAGGDAVDAYRRDYVTRKAVFCVWQRGRPAPAWYAPKAGS